MGKLDNLMAPLREVSLPRPNATVLLFLAAVVAVVLANSPLNDWYQSVLNYPIEVKVLGFELFQHHGHTMSLSLFVNDFLMAIFFLVVGLEIKQEMVVGELSSVKKSLLPIIAAFGGMIMPVILFYTVAPEAPASLGAAIPMATDIAFALALIAALGSRVPSSLRIFLMALAVVDDIGGIIIIALFYSSGVLYTPLLIAALILLVIYIVGRMGVEHPFFYFMMFLIVWYLFLQSGIHATIAGVCVAFCVPMTTKVRVDRLQQQLRSMFEQLPLNQKENRGAVALSHDQIHVTSSIRKTLGSSISPVQTLEHIYSPLVSFIILPLFAFCNAGVNFGEISADGLMGVPLAIFLGLFVGKTLGISLFTWTAIKTKLCSWPEGMTLGRLLPLSVFGGVGFTVSLFIAGLAYGGEHPELLNQAKLGIFAGTIVSGIVGYFWLGHVIRSTSKS